MAVLGELEAAVMAVLWSRDSAASVRDVHSQLVNERDLAYTTVMTVLDRLSKKGVVSRELQGRAWLYSPLVTHVGLVVAEVTELLTPLARPEQVEVARRVQELVAEGDGTSLA